MGAISNLDKAPDTYKSHDKIILFRDFNAEVTENCISAILY